MVGRYKEVADPLYSTIQIPREIVPIVDHPLVQRLRFVRQLQTVHRVYPSATHTRFEHSLGTMHLAGIFAEQLSEDPYDKLLAMIGGLLHDVGHGPYSHTFDDVIRKEFKPGRNHEVFGHKLILSTDLADAIEAAGADPKDVVELLESGRTPISYTVVNRIYPADILDFVNRDLLHTNVDVAHVKRERLVRNSQARGNLVVLGSKALDTLKTLLVSRRDLFTKVYLHKTSIVVDFLVRSIMTSFYALYAEILEKALEGDYQEFLGLTDERVIQDALRDASVRNLALALLRRELPYKAIYREEFSIPLDIPHEARTRGLKSGLEEILESLGVEGRVFVYPLKNIPDNPFDEGQAILLDTGPKKYSEILPDRSLYTIFVRVYAKRDQAIDEAAIVERIKSFVSAGGKQGITM